MINLESRRSFLKKAAYVAPVVLAMGPLASQVNAAGSKIYTNKTAGTTVKAGASDKIVVANIKSGNATAISSPKLTNFNKFLRK